MYGVLKKKNLHGKVPWSSWYGNAALAATLSDVEPDNVGDINLTAIVNIIPAPHATERAQVRKFLSFLLLGLIVQNRARRIASNLYRANQITIDAQSVFHGMHCPAPNLPPAKISNV